MSRRQAFTTEQRAALRMQTAFSAMKERTPYTTQARQAVQIASLARQVKDPKTTVTTTSKTTSKVKTVNITAQVRTMGGYRSDGLYYGIDIGFAIARMPTHGGVVTGGPAVPSPVLTQEEKDNWGTGFCNPLVNPHKNCIYVVRAKISQLTVDPLIGGFKLQWVPPAEWGWADGLTRLMYVEATSNPLYVARLFRSPLHTITNSVFRVLVLERYP